MPGLEVANKYLISALFLVDDDLFDLHHRVVFLIQFLTTASRHTLFQLVEGLYQVRLDLGTQLLGNDLLITLRNIEILEGTLLKENAITSADV